MGIRRARSFELPMRQRNDVASKPKSSDCKQRSIQRNVFWPNIHNDLLMTLTTVTKHDGDVARLLKGKLDGTRSELLFVQCVCMRVSFQAQALALKLGRTIKYMKVSGLSK